jgi:hypothetical protein
LGQEFCRYEKLQHNILWTFLNYTFAPEEEIRRIIQLGLIDKLAYHAQNPKEKNYEHLLGILGNISGTSIALRNDLF